MKVFILLQVSWCVQIMVWFWNYAVKVSYYLSAGWYWSLTCTVQFMIILDKYVNSKFIWFSFWLITIFFALILYNINHFIRKLVVHCARPQGGSNVLRFARALLPVLLCTPHCALCLHFTEWLSFHVYKIVSLNKKGTEIWKKKKELRDRQRNLLHLFKSLVQKEFPYARIVNKIQQHSITALESHKI